jgi:hypothetical protein
LVDMENTNRPLPFMVSPARPQGKTVLSEK